jgi:mRNA-degrading endonuclease RelE of RelBE toxin-antitoxin system
VGYIIEIVPGAEEEYLKLPGSIQSRIKQNILSLETNPRPIGSRKLRESSYYRIRTGDSRCFLSQRSSWIPACAGMTRKTRCNRKQSLSTTLETLKLSFLGELFFMTDRCGEYQPH